MPPPREVPIVLPLRELLPLPRWAVVAFAVRSSRMVQPLFSKEWSQAPKRHTDALSQMLDIAERTAATAHSQLLFSEAIPIYKAGVSAALDAGGANAYSAVGAARAAQTAFAAAIVATCNPPDAARPILGGYPEEVIECAKKPGYYGLCAYAADYAVYAQPLIDVYFREEIKRLRSAASQQSWDDDTPVSPDFFQEFPGVGNPKTKRSPASGPLESGPKRWWQFWK